VDEPDPAAKPSGNIYIEVPKNELDQLIGIHEGFVAKGSEMVQYLKAKDEEKGMLSREDAEEFDKKFIKKLEASTIELTKETYRRI
jgi:hypothetical protein